MPYERSPKSRPARRPPGGPRAPGRGDGNRGQPGGSGRAEPRGGGKSSPPSAPGRADRTAPDSPFQRGARPEAGQSRRGGGAPAGRFGSPKAAPKAGSARPRHGSEQSATRGPATHRRSEAADSGPPRTDDVRAPTVAAAGVTHVAASADDAGQRLDNWLLRRMKGVPKSHVYRILRKGEVRVNGKRAKPEYRVAAGDDVRLPPVRSSVDVGPTRVPDALIRTVESCVVHEDADVIAIAKPPGLAVHGGSGLSFGVIESLRASRPDEVLELVHRLDRETSGLLLVARNRQALRTMHALIREGRMDKRYLALVKGQWDLGRKTIDVPLDVRAKQGGERMVRVREGGKESESTFEAVDFFGAKGTLMQVDIATGRTHQIRVHAAFAGHPIAGDDKYGDREFNEQMRELGLTRMFLHAHAVSFEWPGSGRTFALSVPLPPELAAVVERLATSKRKRKRR